MAALAIAIAAFAMTLAAATPVETLVEVQGPTGVLKGTMLAPPGATTASVVLIIPGSGPTDRDGDSPLGVKASSYRLLAEALAGLGVTSVRIDKRGSFASAGAALDPQRMTMADYAADTHAWVADMRRRTGARCVWLLGHSEGGLVALITAQTANDICGLVLVSAAGRRLSDVMREQFKANPANAPILDQALGAIDKLEAGQSVDVTGMHPAVAQVFRPAVQNYLIDEYRYDPPELVKTYRGPVLVLQGTTDLQVSLADAERLASARPGVKLVELAGVNHMLKLAPADRTANLATYADPSLPLAPGVADAIAAFVKAHPAAN
ncbi:MAG: alpha/beta hydrolase [Caulobacterales bacterium]